MVQNPYFGCKIDLWCKTDWGYNIIPLDSDATGVVDELLEGVQLLLLVPSVDEGVREAFLGAMGGSTLQFGDIPVIALSMVVEDIPALTDLAYSKAARVKARPRPDTALTPPETQYGATLGTAGKGNPSKYAGFANPCTPLQRMTDHS